MALLQRCLLVVWLLGFAMPGRAQAAGPVEISAPVLQSYFPAGIIFTGQATGRAALIVAAGLYYRVQGDDVIYHVELPVRPGRQVPLRYEWDPRGLPLPPGAQVWAHWEAADAAGNRVRGPEASMVYEDTRFAWQRTANARVEVWWHDLLPDTGPLALAIAGEALEYEWRIYQVKPAYPVRVYLYNNHEEFSAWQTGVADFVGGRAFPALGVTAQVFRPGVDSERWLRAVIPHELARLHFYRAAYHPRNPAPLWLDEGLALYTEQVEHPEENATLQAAAVRQALIPLRQLDPDFGAGEAGVRLAQAEALSAVIYLMQAHGPEEMVALLQAYRAGLPEPEAFRTALGTSPEAFEDAWLIWLGVPKAWRKGESGGLPARAQPLATLTPTVQATDTRVATGTLTMQPRGGDRGPDAAPAGWPVALLITVIVLPLAIIWAVSLLRQRRAGGSAH